MGSSTIKIQQSADKLEVFFSGPINEDIDLERVRLDDQLENHLHLDSLTRLNSTGIRKWILWIKPFKEAVMKLWGCTPQFINFLNTVDSAVSRRAKVESFYVPYYSEDTGEEKLELILRKDWDKSPGRLNPPLDSQGKPMLPDVIEEDYLRFLSRY